MNRRNFIYSTTGLLAVTLTGMAAVSRKAAPRLAFSTLGCPDWTFAQITDFAAAHGYGGIEMRCIQRQMDLPQCREFNSPENIRATLRLLNDKQLKITDLGSSATLHYDDPAVRRKNLDEGKRFIDLAQQLGCPYIRVFPDKFPPGKEHDAVIALIVSGLTELGDHAKGSNVTVLMETHGEVVKTADVQKIMMLASHNKTGIIWDVVNMWSETKEPPALVYDALKKYIRHTHIKDATVTKDNLTYTLMGKGNTPVFDAIDILDKAGYDGYYSFEWEKLWHPEIAAPEIALADFPKAMKRHFAG